MRGGRADGAFNGVITGIIFGIDNNRLFNAVTLFNAFFQIEKDIWRLDNADFNHAFFLATG